MLYESVSAKAGKPATPEIQRTNGPRYMGMDTHALSYLAQRTALEVLAANQIESVIQRDNRVTPTPAISRTTLSYNRKRKRHLADAIVVTPSHNQPIDGGFKYKPPHGGPDILRVLVSVLKWRKRDESNHITTQSGPESLARQHNA